MVLDFFAGCIGGSAGLIVGYPLDTIKVHIQTQNSINPQYRGTWHCFQSILAKESIAGFYKGITSPLAGVAVINAIVFGIYGHTQKHIIDSNDNLTGHFIAGAAAGLAQSPVASPLELAKTRLQLQTVQVTTVNSNFARSNKLPTVGNKINNSHIYTSPLQCLCDIYRKNGITGVYSGLTVTACREVPSYGLYFLTYEACIKTCETSSVSTFHMLIAGGIAGTVSWIFTYPIDVVKSRLQADNQGRYSSAMDCYRKSLRDEGFKCFFRGLNSTLIRAFPTNAITFAAVHWTYRICGGVSQHVDNIKNKMTGKQLPSADNVEITSMTIYQYNDNDYNCSNNDNSSNRIWNHHHHHHQHSNVLLDNFNSIFNSIINNQALNLCTSASSGANKHQYKNSE